MATQQQLNSQPESASIRPFIFLFFLFVLFFFPSHHLPIFFLYKNYAEHHLLSSLSSPALFRSSKDTNTDRTRTDGRTIERDWFPPLLDW